MVIRKQVCQQLLLSRRLWREHMAVMPWITIARTYIAKSVEADRSIPLFIPIVVGFRDFGVWWLLPQMWFDDVLHLELEWKQRRQGTKFAPKYSVWTTYCICIHVICLHVRVCVYRDWKLDVGSGSSCLRLGWLLLALDEKRDRCSVIICWPGRFLKKMHAMRCWSLDLFEPRHTTKTERNQWHHHLHIGMLAMTVSKHGWVTDSHKNTWNRPRVELVHPEWLSRP